MTAMVGLQHWLLAAIMLLYTSRVVTCSDPSRLSVDFSSSLIVSPENTPTSVLQSLNALLSDMTADGVNNVCNGRLDRHVCKTPVSQEAAPLGRPFLSATDATSSNGNTGPDSCTLCKNPIPADTLPCSCSAPGNRTRCTCAGTLTGAEYFNPQWYSLELAYVLAVAENDNSLVSGTMNANFNSTVRLINSVLTITPAADSNGEGVHDLELDESHLDLMQGSQLLLHDDADLEVEDNGGLWLSGRSLISAAGSSNIQIQLSHVLVEGSSSVTVESGSEWNMTQEFDMTPAQAAAVCDQPFQPNSAAKYCFSNKDECKQQFDQLSGAEKQALGMLKYPPALDRWGRQAFDYTDDVTYDDYYDEDYVEHELTPGACLGPEVCGSSSSSSISINIGPVSISISKSSGSSSGSSSGGRRLKRSLLAADFITITSLPAILDTGATLTAASSNSNNSSNSSSSNDSTSVTPAAAAAATTGTNIQDNKDRSNNSDNTDSSTTAAAAAATPEDQDNKDSSSDIDSSSNSNNTGSSSTTATAGTDSQNDSSNESGSASDSGDNAQGYLNATEINAPDTLDGSGYDPEWGEGPFGETLCDAPPGKAFNYYGLVVHDNSHIRISGNSTWVIYDTSRAFIKDSTVTLTDNSSLILLNTTLVLINSTLDISSRSQIILQHFSSLQLYQSRVIGDGAMYAVPAGATWQGEAWQQRGDYRASPGGGLPVSMGARPGVQLGSYPMRIFGLDLEARLLPAAGCSCKQPHTVVTPADKVINIPQSAQAKQGWSATLEGLI